MNWKLVLGLSGFGVIMGVLGVLGVTGKQEQWYWLTVMVISALVLGKLAPGKWIWHGLALAFANTIWSTLITLALYSTYAANNPEIMADFTRQAGGRDVRLLWLIMVPVIGILSGIVQGLFAWGAAALFGRTKAETAGAS